LHADLAALGYDGSFNSVAASAREWKATHCSRCQVAASLYPLGLGRRRLQLERVMAFTHVRVEIVSIIADQSGIVALPCRRVGEWFFA
jgi:hypothetical protein